MAASHTPSARAARDRYISTLLSDSVPQAAPPPAATPWTPGANILPRPPAAAPVTPTPAAVWGSPLTPHQAHVVPPAEPDIRVTELMAGLVAAGKTTSQQDAHIRQLSDELSRERRRSYELRRRPTSSRRYADETDEPPARGTTRSTHRRSRSGRSDPHDRRDGEFSDEDRDNDYDREHDRASDRNNDRNRDLNRDNRRHSDPYPRSRSPSPLPERAHRRSRGSSSNHYRKRDVSPISPADRDLDRDHDRDHDFTPTQPPLTRPARTAERRTTRHIHFSPLAGTDPARLSAEGMTAAAHQPMSAPIPASPPSTHAPPQPSVQPIPPPPPPPPSQPPALSPLEKEVLALRAERANWVAERRRSQSEEQALSAAYADFKRHADRLVYERERLLSEKDEHLTLIAQQDEELEKMRAALSSEQPERIPEPVIEEQSTPASLAAAAVADTQQARASPSEEHELASNVRAELEEELRLTLEENQRLVEEKHELADEKNMLVEQKGGLEAQCHILSDRLEALAAASVAQPTVTHVRVEGSPGAEQLNRLIEEVDFLEGVCQGVFFGSRRDRDCNGSVTREISLTHPNGLPPRNGLASDAAQRLADGDDLCVPADAPVRECDEVVRGLVQRVADIRSGLSLKFGRWVDALNQNGGSDDATLTTSSAPGDMSTGSIDVQRLIREA